MPIFSKVVRVCEWCGESFWGTERARFDSSSCRGRHRRAHAARSGAPLVSSLCEEVLRRRNAGTASYSKLLPRLFRAIAAELARAGWDPITLLITRPEDPASEPDSAPGGIEGEGRQRRKWLYPPDEEILLLQGAIRHRAQKGLSVLWHQKRLEMLRAVVSARGH